MNKIEKVCFVIGGLAAGGAERVVATLANSFALKKIAVTIMCIGREEIESTYKLDDSVKVAHIVSGYSSNIIFRKSKQFKEMRNYILENRPDIIISFLDYVNVQILYAFRKTKIPIVISIRVDPMYMGNKILKILCHLLYVKANAAVFQTKEQQDFFKSCNNRLDIIIMNPLRQEMKKEVLVEYRDKVTNICSIGRLTEQKNYKLLINAFYIISLKFPQIKLTIYGEGEERLSLERIIEKKGLKNKISMPGISKNIIEKLEETDIFVLSSNFEGVPNALIEAMCMGIPCITTEFSGGGAKMLIENEVNGLLLQSNDEDSLASSIERLIKDISLRKKMGSNAVTLREKVDIDCVTNQWIELIENIISKNRGEKK